MAGGKDAVFKAKEGVEDDYEEGARAVARLRPTKKDVVIGVSASGMTPFVRGSLTRARKSGLRIIFVTCWPGADLTNFVDLIIAPNVGPEVLAGSTRLKAGTATKMVLNILTTAAMVRIGKTYGNLMVDVQATSEKLKDRSRRIVGIVTGLDYDAAGDLLKRARWNVKTAIVMQKTGLSQAKANARLRRARRLDAGSDWRRHRAASSPIVEAGRRASRIGGAVREDRESRESLGSDLPPRMEGVRNPHERRRERRMVPQQYRQHRVVLDPIQPDLRVDLRRVVVGVEAIALQAARRHQDEDAERACR